MKPFLWVTPIALLAGCQTPRTPEPIKVVTEVVTWKAISCVPLTLADPPHYPDDDLTLLGASGADERYRLVIAGRVQREARLRQLEPIITICKGVTE